MYAYVYIHYTIMLITTNCVHSAVETEKVERIEDEPQLDIVLRAIDNNIWRTQREGI